MENPIKMDDLGVPLFSETPISNLESSHIGKSHLPVKEASTNGAVRFILAKLQLFHQPIDFPQNKGGFPFPFQKKLHFGGPQIGFVFSGGEKTA